MRRSDSTFALKQDCFFLFCAHVISFTHCLKHAFKTVLGKKVTGKNVTLENGKNITGKKVTGKNATPFS